jgi:hypothetical protein
MLTPKIGKTRLAGLTGGPTRSDRTGQSPQKAIWASPLYRSHRVHKDPWNVQFGVRMKEIWLLKDLHIAEVVRPTPIGG